MSFFKDTIRQIRATTPETPDKTNARIYREQWADWENRFKPFQGEAVNSILDPQKRQALDDEALANSQSVVDTAFNRAESRIQTLAGRLPESTDPQIQEARKRQLIMGRRGAKVDAYNDTQKALADRDMERLAG